MYSIKKGMTVDVDNDMQRESFRNLFLIILLVVFPKIWGTSH
jgi:hypothetical protein